MTDPIVEMLSMSQAELDALYRKSPAGPIPVGKTRGTAVVAPGTVVARALAPLIKGLVWQGKRFDPERGDLLNCISPFRFKAVRARVYLGESRFDGGNSIVIDYSKTSLIARMIRDEIRQVTPGLYLGFAYWGQVRFMSFWLSVPDPDETMKRSA